MNYTGVVRFYSRLKGYGVVVPDDVNGKSTDDQFIHHSSLMNCKYLNAGQRITFEIGPNPKKHDTMAIKVHLIVSADDVLSGRVASQDVTAVRHE